MTGIENGLTWDAMERMTLGQVVDFCIERDTRRKKAEKSAGKKGGGGTRNATQADINAFLGG